MARRTARGRVRSFAVIAALLAIPFSVAYAVSTAVLPVGTRSVSGVTAPAHPGGPGGRAHPAVLAAREAPVATRAAAAARLPSTQRARIAGQAPATRQARATRQAPQAPSGGICQVPGIGDIGGLFGFCSAGSSGLIGVLNNVCQPGLPQPEPANSGIDALIRPPAGVATGKTLYDNYGVAGQDWNAYGLQCSDMASLIGNNVAGAVFDAAKAVDRVTITVYQSAAGNGILTWLQNVVDTLITALGNAIYFPYLAPVIIIGAIWLAWQGLVRKRATRTIEGTLWMVAACAAAIWLIGRPADFTGVGTTVSNGVTQVLNVAFARLPSTTGGDCLPVGTKDPQAASASYAFTSSNGVVGQNANELWSVLVCEPWLDGELGTTSYATSSRQPQTVVNTYGRGLLWAQAIAANERPTAALIKAKQATYAGIASDLQQKHPDIYPLFQGNQWTTRLEIGFAALFAALVAGLLILLVSLTLIILKLGFLLLLVAGPFFLIVGTHPGAGRIVAIRWLELLIGVLMKQVAIALVLSVLLYAYSLIMGTSAAVLPWALKILMIALVTVAVFIYRKPFQHLFSAVGYGLIDSRERMDIHLRRASETFRRATLDTATATVPGVAAYRIGRWARRNPEQAAALAAGVVGAAGVASAAAAANRAASAVEHGGATAGSAARTAPVEAADGFHAADDQAAFAGAAGASPSAGPRPSTAERTRRWPTAGGDGIRPAPPLHLPPRDADGDANGRPSGWARGGDQLGAGPRSGEAPPRPGTGPASPRPRRWGAPPGAGRGTSAPTPGRGTPAPDGRTPAGAPGGRGPAAPGSRGTTWPGVRAAAPGPGWFAGSGAAGVAGPAGGRTGGSPAGGAGWWAAASRPTTGWRTGAPPLTGTGGAPTNGHGAGANGGTAGEAPRGAAPGGGARSGAPAWPGGGRPAPTGATRARWQPGPIRPSSGWSGTTRTRSDGDRGQAAPPPANGPGQSRPADEGPVERLGPPMPFWLRPVRRKK